jgi:acylphosphatase
MKTIKIEVYGRVQGVYFRANTCQKALELGIKGHVKNQHDGSVEIIAEGEEGHLQKLVDWCYKGPVLAAVTEVKVSNTDFIGYSEFVTLK